MVHLPVLLMAQTRLEGFSITEAAEETLRLLVKLNEEQGLSVFP
ncbi:hypothetical protein [Grimontia kaedaensis]|nr:hypothetical protein [Grimontia kaedaensis]